MDRLLGAIAEMCEDGLRRAVPASGGLRRILRGLAELDAPRPGEGEDLAVVRTHLARALSLARGPAARGLADAVQADAAAIAWRPTRFADDQPWMADFLPCYAVAPIAGPDRYGRPCPYYSERMTLGMTLQAPNLHYPAHAHKAVEIYFLVGGSVDWQQGDGVWRRLAPGDFVLHRRDEPHAMQTRDEPLLAFFAWVSDLDSTVRIVTPPGGAEAV